MKYFRLIKPSQNAIIRDYGNTFAGMCIIQSIKVMKETDLKEKKCVSNGYLT